MIDDSSEYNGEEEQEESKSKRHFWKLLFIFLILGFAFMALFARLFYLQVIKYEKYKELARHQQESRVQLKAERGNIYDRNGLLLASNISSISFAVDPTLIKDERSKVQICQALENKMGIPAEKTLEKINSARGSFVWLIRSLLPSEAIKLDSVSVKAFIKIEEPKRNYLYGLTASQVIGCTDIDNRGLTGIELGLDSSLRGRSGYMIMNRDATGKLMPSADLPKVMPVHGKLVRLTIDINLQKILEYELANGVRKAGAVSGTAIAIEPSTGEILAMDSYPSYNPSDLSQSGSGTMKNKSITDVYEPGSTFKLITAAAALNEGMVAPNTILDGYNGLLQFKDLQIRDDHPLGKISFEEALEKSSNIIFSTVANSLPSNLLYKYIRDFGFGYRSGIDLPGEVPGVVKKPDDFDMATKRFLGFGYGISVTPLQLLNAYAAIANDGILMKPHIIKEISDINGRVIYSSVPEKIRKVVSGNTVEELTKMLIGVVEKGTGISAAIPGVKIAGKTGTTQQITSGSYSKNNYTASFAGFFPAENPKIAMLIILDKPSGDYYGGSTAAPIFHAIAKSWIALNPEILNPGEQNDNQKPIFVPDIKGMYVSDAIQLLSSYGLKLATNYNPDDVVLTQEPKSDTYKTNPKFVNITVWDKSEKKMFIPKINVVGLSLRKAVAWLHNSGYHVKIIGSGKVTEQSWTKDSTGTTFCILRCN